jgi:hypothetical protein
MRLATITPRRTTVKSDKNNPFEMKFTKIKKCHILRTADQETSDPTPITAIMNTITMHMSTKQPKRRFN